MLQSKLDAITEKVDDLKKWIATAPLTDVVNLYDYISQVKTAIKEAESALDERFIEEAEGTYITAAETKIYKTVETKKTVRRDITFDALSIPEDMRDLFSAGCFKPGAVGKILGAEYVIEEKSDRVVVKALTENQAKFLDKLKAV